MSEVPSVESVLIFSSAHHMLRAEQTLLDAGLDIELVAAPKAAGELCTTAICFHADLEKQVRESLAQRRIEVKDILAYQRPQAARRALTLEEIVGALEARGAGRLATLVEAGKATERSFGMRANLMAIVGPDGAGIEEALELGIPLVLVDLAHEEPQLARLRSRLGDERCIATAITQRLNARLIDDLGSCGVRYFLTPGTDPAGLSAIELADELVFLRDNRTGIVGTGSLVPLLEPASGKDTGRQRLLRIMAVARLVMPDAYIPAPAWLWPDGIPGACNLMLVEAAGGELKTSVRELQAMLKSTGRRLLTSVEERCS